MGESCNCSAAAFEEAAQALQPKIDQARRDLEGNDGMKCVMAGAIMVSLETVREALRSAAAKARKGGA